MAAKLLYGTAPAHYGKTSREYLVKRAVIIGAARMRAGPIEVVNGGAWWPELAPLGRRERNYVYGVLGSK